MLIVSLYQTKSSICYETLLQNPQDCIGFLVLLAVVQKNYLDWDSAKSLCNIEVRLPYQAAVHIVL